LLSLAIAQVLPGFAGERHWIRYAHAHLRHLFPYIPQQSGCSKRLRAAGPLIAAMIRELALVTPTGVEGLRLIDSTRCRAACPGRPPSARTWPVLTSAEGMPLMWCLASPRLGEREVMTAMLEAGHHLVAEGQVILADRGFAGGESEKLRTELGVHLVRPARRGSSDPALTPAERSLLRMRQLAEAVSGTLKGQLSLERHGARTHVGIFARIGLRLLAMAAALWHDTRTGAPSKRSLIAYDH
jgi:hypothetical protein